ncbi:MAG: NAD(P)-binding protein [Acidimicrobiia bacterium]|nr:NAD(P)-binding protein [Acidimicrobiia bacterium]
MMTNHNMTTLEKEMTKALIVGGGIAGPVAAMALQKAGIESVVYERYPEATDRRGAFLTLGSNGLAALETLDAADGAVANGFPTSEIALRSTTGKFLGLTPIGVELENGLTSHAVRRADLYSALHKEAATRGLQIEYGKKAVEFEEGESGVRVTFADGSVAEGDIAIGCDGIHSKLRKAIDPNAPAPVYAGLVGFGG